MKWVGGGLLALMVCGQVGAQTAATEETAVQLLEVGKVLMWLAVAALGFFGYSVGARDV